MNKETLEKQSFCPDCGRNYDLENFGDESKPVWRFPKHIVRKNVGNSTKVCRASGQLVKN